MSHRDFDHELTSLLDIDYQQNATLGLRSGETIRAFDRLREDEGLFAMPSFVDQDLSFLDFGFMGDERLNIANEFELH